jgi:thiol-disulfide isomerase/thioredoxin
MFIKVTDPQSAQDFNKRSNNGYWVVLYYADWCPHCQTMKPEWQRFADKYKTNPDINVAELESQFLDMLSPIHKSNVQGFPTIVSLAQGQKQSDYSGARTSKDIDLFANSQYNNAKSIIKSSSNLNKILRNDMKKTKRTYKKRKYTPRKTTKSKSSKSTKRAKRTPKKAKRTPKK